MSIKCSAHSLENNLRINASIHVATQEISPFPRTRSRVFPASIRIPKIFTHEGSQKWRSAHTVAHKLLHNPRVRLLAHPHLPNSFSGADYSGDGSYNHVIPCVCRRAREKCKLKRACPRMCARIYISTVCAQFLGVSICSHDELEIARRNERANACAW